MTFKKFCYYYLSFTSFTTLLLLCGAHEYLLDCLVENQETLVSLIESFTSLEARHLALLCCIDHLVAISVALSPDPGLTLFIWYLGIFFWTFGVWWYYKGPALLLVGVSRIEDPSAGVCTKRISTDQVNPGLLNDQTSISLIDQLRVLNSELEDVEYQLSTILNQIELLQVDTSTEFIICAFTGFLVLNLFLFIYLVLLYLFMHFFSSKDGWPIRLF